MAENMKQEMDNELKTTTDVFDTNRNQIALEYQELYREREKRVAVIESQLRQKQ